MRPKKSFGQHFLHDRNVVARIVDDAEPERFPLVVEIGPGQGALTGAIMGRLSQSGRLVLVEADRDLIPDLQQQFPAATIVNADAAQIEYVALLRDGTRDVPADRLYGSWLFIGNLPYNAASAILMHALQAPQPPERAVIMVQKEVGERMLGLSGHMSVLGVAVGLYAHVDKVCTVKPGAFTPPPKVDSVVLRLTIRHDRRPDIEDIVRFAKAGFAARRKVLASNLARAKLADAQRVQAWLAEHSLPPDVRAEALTVPQWVGLYTFCQEVA